MPATPRTPVGSKRDRFLVILVGVVAGYFIGRTLEARLEWENARMLTMPLGGLVSGVIGRFTLDRFRDAPDGAKGPRRLR